MSWPRRRQHSSSPSTTWEDVICTRERVPHAALQEYVSSYYFSLGNSAAGTQTVRCRLISNGCVSLRFDVGERSPVDGGHATYIIDPCVVPINRDSKHFGVRFTPAGAFPMLGCQAESLLNGVPLVDLWGYHAVQLHERLLGTPSTIERLQIIETELWQRAQRAAHVHAVVAQAVQQIHRTPHAVSVRALMQATGYSRRQIQRVFRQWVGMSAKQFIQFIRFRRALDGMAQQVPSQWALFALDHGYADQAHFIREFKRYTGLTPTRFCAPAATDPRPIIPSQTFTPIGGQ